MRRNPMPPGVGIMTGIALFAIPPAMAAAKEAGRQHKSRNWAATKSFVQNTWQQSILVGMGGFAQTRAMLYFMALPAVGMAVSAATSYAQARNLWVRQAATPFSHRFDASDWTAAAQQRGMQSITGYRNIIGNEAASLNSRYMRR